MKAVTKFAGHMVLAMAGAATGAFLLPAAADATGTGTATATGTGTATATATATATGTGTGTGTDSAPAAAPTLPSLVAYVRGGNVFVSKGATEKPLTSDGGYSRPRWSPDGKRLALLRNGMLWTMNADGTGKRQLTDRPAAGPSWSPDSRWIAFASLSCSGGPGVFRIAATAPAAKPEVMFPRDCRGEDLPAIEPVVRAAAGTLTDRLRADDAVAWSPDGARVAFRGGDCESIYDACLSVGNVATGGEKTVAAYGGGSLQNSGFAVVPNWRADGAKLAWTAYETGETSADDQAVHIVEYDTVSGAKRTIGGALDRELAYVDARRGVATAQYQNGSWVMVVNLANGARTPFHAGSQPSVQPVK